MVLLKKCHSFVTGKMFWSGESNLRAQSKRESVVLESVIGLAKDSLKCAMSPTDIYCTYRLSNTAIMDIQNTGTRILMRVTYAIFYLTFICVSMRVSPVCQGDVNPQEAHAFHSKYACGRAPEGVAAARPGPLSSDPHSASKPHDNDPHR